MKKTKGFCIKFFKRLILITFISLQGCEFKADYFEKDLNDLELGIGLKIGTASYTASELFEDISEELEISSFDDNGTSLVSFVYEEELDGSDNDDFIAIETQRFEGNFEILKNTNLPATSTVYNSTTATVANSIIFEENETQKLQLNKVNIDLTSAEFSNGKLALEVNTTTDAQVDVVFSIPSLILKSDGVTTYSKAFTLNSTTTPNLNKDDIDLSLYTVNLTIPNSENSNDMVNNISFGIDATITFREGDQISSTDLLNYTADLSALEDTTTLTSPTVSIVNGDFKQETLTVDPVTFDLDFFNELGEGNISFVNPTFTITATNEFGLPLGLTTGNITTTSTGVNTLTIDETLTNNVEINTDTPTDGDYLIFSSGSVNNPSNTTITLNNVNSNLAALLEEKPTAFNLAVNAIANPNSSIVNTNIYEFGSEFNVNLKVELPLFVAFDNLNFSVDPTDIDLQDLDNSVSSINLIIQSRNTIPMSAILALHFLDINGNQVTYTDANGISQIFSKNINNLISAAPVNNQNFSTYNLVNDELKQGNTIIAPTTVNLSLTKEEIIALNNVEQISFDISFNTTDSNNDDTPDAVKLKTTDSVKIDVSLTGETNIKL